MFFSKDVEDSTEIGFIQYTLVLKYFIVDYVSSSWKKCKHFIFIIFTDPYFNPLSPGIRLQILLLCFHIFLTEVVGRSC